MKKIKRVPQKDNKLGEEERVKARNIALHLFGLDRRKCTKQINDPSNSIPYSEESVTGLNKLQKIFSEVFATMNKEIPDPRP